MTASASSTPGGEPPASGAPAAPSGAAVSEERLEKLQNQLEVLMGCMTTMASQQASSQQMMEQRMAVLSEATARCNRRVRRASATSESLATLSVLAGPSGALPRTCSSESMKDELEIEKQLGHLGSTMSLQRGLGGSAEAGVAFGRKNSRANYKVADSSSYTLEDDIDDSFGDGLKNLAEGDDPLKEDAKPRDGRPGTPAAAAAPSADGARVSDLSEVGELNTELIQAGGESINAFAAGEPKRDRIHAF